MKMPIVLISVIGVLLASCGKSNENEYAISRLADMITLYWVLPPNSEIANFELKDNVLELDIDTDKQQVTRQGTDSNWGLAAEIYRNHRKPRNA